LSTAWQQLEGSTVNGVYRLDRLLGETPTSAVFAATLRREARPYAIKLVIASQDSTRVLARWERASRVAHRHLIGIAGIGRAVLGGREMLFAAVERADDVLADALAERALSMEEMRDLVIPCLEALDHLHSRGLAHGSLTPSNVLAVGDTVKLTADNVLRFGEELRPGPDSPPESAASAASDVWSLGKLIAAALHSSDPPDPYGDVVRGCLAADPRQRWTLHAIRQRLSPAVLRPARGARAVRFGVIGGLVTALVAAVVIVPRIRDEAPPEPSPPVEETRLPVPVPQQSPEPAPPPATRPVKPAREPAPPRRPPEPASQPRAEPRREVDSGDAVLSGPLPDVAPESLRTVSGKIRVSVGVTVDDSGSVTGASLESAGPSRYFAQQCLRAAGRWKFAAGAAGRWLVRFEITSSGVTSSARRAW
jgi:serine/threonine protein kinase